MSEIKVNTTSLKHYASRLSQVNNRVIQLNGRIKRLYSQVGLQGLYNLIQADALTGHNWKLTRAQNYLNQTASDFESVENHLYNLDPTNFNSNRAGLGNIVNSYKDIKRGPIDVFKDLQKIFRFVSPAYVNASSESAWSKYWSGNLKKKIEDSLFEIFSNDEESYIKFLTGALGVSLTPSAGYEYDDAFNEKLNHFLQTKGSKLPKQKEYKGIQIGEDENFYDKRGTILETKAEAKAEGSLLDSKLSGDSEYAEGSLEGKLLTGEAHANAAAGLYVYEKDKDGNTKRIFSPGVSAEVGASASVLEISADGRIGLGEDKKGLGLYGDADVKALSAEAKAKAAVNKNEVYVGASAEANLIKATASGGISVLGTDVGVTGSVKVGVGAHANAGYTDGKLKVDIGAAVGVGVDVGFEIDVGGTVEAVCDTAEAAWNGAKNIFHSVFG